MSQYGVSIEMNEEGIGTPIYRMNEIHDMLCDSRISKCAKLTPEETANFKLLKRDVLFNRTNSQAFVGRTGVFQSSSSIDRVFASYLVRFRTDHSRVLPEYLATFLNTERGIREVKRRARMSINQSNVNPEEVKDIRIPLLSLNIQLKVESLFSSAHQRLVESEFLQAQAEQTLLSALDLENWQPPTPLSYEANASDTFTAGRIDAEFFQPKFEDLETHIKQTGEYLSLGLLTEQIQRGKQPKYAEKGIQVVNSKHVNNGEISLSDDNRFATWDGKSILIEKGDVVINGTGVGTIGRSAPYLGETPLIPDNHVTVIKSSQTEIDAVYLSIYLNSIAGQMQVDQYFKGSSGQIELYPNDISNFIVWIAPREIQAKVRQCVEDSHLARQQSKSLLERAKRAVEIAIEQDEETALAYLDGKHFVAEEILPRCFTPERHYISLKKVQEIVESEGLQYETSTIRRYLAEWQSQAKIYDAGRAWYSNLPETFTPETKVIETLEKALLADFPYLEWNAWSTQQLASFFHHLPSRHVTFLMVDRDTMEPIAESLSSQGFTVVTHPTGQLAKSFQLDSEVTIIIRPKLSADHTKQHAPIEQILVDFIYENQKLSLFDHSEIDRIIHNCINRYRVEMSTFLRYAERRKVSIELRYPPSISLCLFF